MPPRTLACLALLACAACGSSAVTVIPGPHDAGPAPPKDASTADATSDASSPTDAPSDVDKSATCVSTFGSALTNAFGRADGTVVAVVPPNDQACALPNSTHLILEVMLQGAVYRMVVDVHSKSAVPDVLLYEMDAPLADGAWSDGWHPGVPLDYVTNLSAKSTQFVSMNEADVVAELTSELELGAHVSVFATSTTAEPNSAHLVHRNLTNQDGAIVVSPETAPHYMLIRFAEQSF